MLTYALLHQAADNGGFSLRGWLREAEQEVPNLYRRALGDRKETPQEPSLLDFARKRALSTGGRAWPEK
ncbi:MAG: hypothetical protein ACKV2V_21340 [Blastocatellia bacterium]